MAWTQIQSCGVVALLCGAWNLFGDLCFLDFYLAHMTFEDFGSINSVSRPGKLFNFALNWPLQLAQAGARRSQMWAISCTLVPASLPGPPSVRTRPWHVGALGFFRPPPRLRKLQKR